MINRIGDRQNLPPGVQPGLSPWSPTGEIVRYVLEGPGYTLNQLKAVQDWVLNRALKQVPGVIDVTGYGGTVKQYQVLIDTRLLRQYNVTLQQVEDAIADVERERRRRHPDARAARRTTSGRSGCSARGSTRSTRRTSTSATSIEAEKLEDIAERRRHHGQRQPDLRPATSPRSSIGHRPRLGMVGRPLKEIGRPAASSDEDDVVEGIVLMRKYEKSLPVSEAVAEKMKEIERAGTAPQGDATCGSSTSGPTWSTSRRTTCCTTWSWAWGW